MFRGRQLTMVEAGTCLIELKCRLLTRRVRVEWTVAMVRHRVLLRVSMARLLEIMGVRIHRATPVDRVR